MDKKRKQAIDLILSTMHILDPSGKHEEYYKNKFAKMNDAEFKRYISRPFPYRFYTRIFNIEPSMSDMEKAAKNIGIQLTEKVMLPYYYTNADGVPVESKECLVIYAPLKKMKQFITKKNSMSIDIAMRDNKTGLLISDDKNGKTSDREMEALGVMGLDQTIRELSRPRADAMDAKSVMYATITTNGDVSLNDLPDDPNDSLAKNLLNVYLLGSGLNSNLLNVDNYLPVTIKNKKRSLTRK